MNFRARLMAIALSVGASACQQAPQPAAPPAAAADRRKLRLASTAKYAANVPASIHA